MLQLEHTNDCNIPAQDHDDCLVHDGIATCQGLIKAFPTNLPPCITRLYIIIKVINGKEFNPVVIKSNELFTQEMSHLEVIEIKLVDRLQDEHFTIKLNIGDTFFRNLPQLRVFRVNTQGEITFTTDAFQSINTTQTLDFTRARQLSLISFIGSLNGLKRNPLRTLILKNVQSVTSYLSSAYIAAVDLSKIICPLVSIKQLDLSFNDIVYLKMSSIPDCYVYMLDILDLRYNLISVYSTENSIIEYFQFYNILFSAVKVLYVDHMWNDHDVDYNLWQDNELLEEDIENQLQNPKHSAKKAQNSAGVFLLIGYVQDWLDEMKEYCPSMNPDLDFPCLLNGLQHVDDDLCSLIKCIFPNIGQTCHQHVTSPKLSYFGNVLSQVLHDQCNLRHCVGNTLFPVFSATELYWHHISGRHIQLSGYALLDPTTNATTICFVQGNSVKVIDLSYSESYGMVPIHYDKFSDVQFAEEFQLAVTGLHRLQKLNLQSVRHPVRISSLLLMDLPALEELHIGGNRLTDNDSQPLPAAYLYNKPNLKLLNLSHAHLPAIEFSTFGNTPQLQTLDLSHNRLTAETFLFNMSNTNLTQIVLNYNSIDSILPDMQKQLAALQNLELDL